MSSQPQSTCNHSARESYCNPQNINECSDSYCKEGHSLRPSLEDIAINENTPSATMSLYKILDTSITTGDDLWKPAIKNSLVTQISKETRFRNSSEHEVNAIRPGDILEWKQVELEELSHNVSEDTGNCVWGAFTGVMRCMNTPVTHHGQRFCEDHATTKLSSPSFFEFVHQHNSLSSTYQKYISKPLGDREGLYPTTEVCVSDPVAYNLFVKPSSLSPRASRRSLLTNTVVSTSQETQVQQPSSSIIIRQPKPNTSGESPPRKSCRARNSEEIQPVEVKLDGLGGAIITFTPLAPSSPSRTIQGLCHTVDCSPRRCFPKTALSFNKRAALCASSKESEQQHPAVCDNIDDTASNEEQDSPSQTVACRAQMHGNHLSKTKVRNTYRTVDLTPTRSPPKLHLAGLSPPSSASQKVKQLTVSEGILLEECRSSSPLSTPLKQSMIERKSTNPTKEIAKSEPRHQADNNRPSVHTVQINNVRDVPVDYDSFIESPLQTRDRDIMHTLNLSPLELCSLGLHNGRTMTPRARAISALRKTKHRQPCTPIHQ